VGQVHRATQQADVLAAVDGGDDEQLGAQVGQQDPEREEEQQPGARAPPGRAGVVPGLAGFGQEGSSVVPVAAGPTITAARGLLPPSPGTRNPNPV
jgi:hypothetical protein